MSWGVATTSVGRSSRIGRGIGTVARCVSGLNEVSLGVTRGGRVAHKTRCGSRIHGGILAVKRGYIGLGAWRRVTLKKENKNCMQLISSNLKFIRQKGKKTSFSSQDLL